MARSAKLAVWKGPFEFPIRGLNRNLTGVGLTSAQIVLNDSGFGSNVQNLSTPATVYSGTARLA